jgi:peptide/nickel transport system ATP-binding protein
LAARYPEELSGGQKQRVNLARALAAEPSLILCDEVVSALDTVVGAAILDLLAELRQALGVALMFISHDITTVRSLCDQVMILYAGQAVEMGGEDVLDAVPAHPYTDLLLSSVPELRTGWLDALTPSFTGPSFTSETGGGLSRADAHLPCPFFRRCPVKIPGTCDVDPPPVRAMRKGAIIMCHRTEDELGVAQRREAIIRAG